MEKEFVPYSIAYRVEELGFNEDCFGFYNNADSNVWIKHKMSVDLQEIYKGDIKAPLWQQVLNWFRVQHNINIYINKSWAINNCYYYIIVIDDDINNQIQQISIERTHDEALEDAIINAIQIIKNK